MPTNVRIGTRLFKHGLVQILNWTVLILWWLLWVIHLWAKHFVEEVLTRFKQLAIPEMRRSFFYCTVCSEILSDWMRHRRSLTLHGILNLLILKHALNCIKFILLFDKVLLNTMILTNFLSASPFFTKKVVLSPLGWWQKQFLACTGVVRGYEDALSIIRMVHFPVLLLSIHLPLVTILKPIIEIVSKLFQEVHIAARIGATFSTLLFFEHVLPGLWVAYAALTRATIDSRIFIRRVFLHSIKHCV